MRPIEHSIQTYLGWSPAALYELPGRSWAGLHRLGGLMLSDYLPDLLEASCNNLVMGVELRQTRKKKEKKKVITGKVVT